MEVRDHNLLTDQRQVFESVAAQTALLAWHLLVVLFECEEVLVTPGVVDLDGCRTDGVAEIFR